MELWKDSCCSRREPSAKLGNQEQIRREDTRHVSKLCVKTLFISETFIPNFVAFFVLFAIAFARCCSRSLWQNGSFNMPAGRPAIVSLSTSQEVDNVH